MGILPIQGSPAEKQYRGCGKAWVAINKNAEVVGIRYMHDFQPEKKEQFGEYRLKCRKELLELGEVQSGMLSCWEFIPKDY